MSAPAPTVEFWFEFASTYSYLSAMRVDAVAKKAGVAVDWKPFLLGPIFGAQGWETSPFNIYPDKGAHMWRDMARRSAASGLTFKQPDPFPQNSLLASRLTLVGLDEGWGEAFARGVYEVEFAHGLNISSERVLEGLLIKAGADPQDAFEQAVSARFKQALKDQTDEAIRRHIFGAPTFIVAGPDGDELFWGDDHLEQAVDWALGRHPAQVELLPRWGRGTMRSMVEGASAPRHLPQKGQD